MRDPILSVEAFKAKWGTRTASLTIRQMANDIMLPERPSRQQRFDICAAATELAEDLEHMLMSSK